MTPAERDRRVAGIVAGVVLVRPPSHPLLYEVRLPSRIDRLMAEEAYRDALHEAEREGLFSEDDLEVWLWSEGHWDEERAKALAQMPQEIEHVKVKLYENRFDPDLLKVGRGMLAKAKDRHADLFAQRHAHDAQLATGYARLARLKHRLASGLFLANEPVYPHGDYSRDDGLLDEVLSQWHSAQLGEADYRDLARNHPWRPIWQAKDSSPSIFGLPACDLTEEQQQLIAVSQLYDNVRQHPECPSEQVLADDDLLDGWLILEQRKRRQEDDRRDIEGQIRDPRIRNSQEVFFVCKDGETARKVRSLNTPGAQARIDARNRAIDQKGEVLLQDLPDVKQRLRMARAGIAES